MHILVAGLNHRSAPVEIREKFVFSENDLPEALRQLKETRSILECVIVATCNRTEIYAVVDRLHQCKHHIGGFLENWFRVSKSDYNSHLYVYEDQSAIEHLLRVASGLDSMIIGETQILGQVRSAFLLAQQERATGTLFNMLFKQAITMAKKAHSETSIGENAVSVSYAAVELGRQIFGDFNNKTVMIIGAGKMSELTGKHLYTHGAQKVIVVNRTFEKAQELADKLQGTAFTMSSLLKQMEEVDIIISSTGADGYVLTRDQVQSVMKKRKSKPLFIIDIAVPRDLDPAIIELNNVFLYDIDDLEGIVKNNLELRRKEADKIEEMIIKEMALFQEWYKTLGLSPVIRALQEKSAMIHEETMQSLFKKLPELDEREVKLIRKLTKSIVNQMLHDPILRVKEMAAGRHGDEAIEKFTQIFALEEMLAEEKRKEAKSEIVEDRREAESAKESAALQVALKWI